ncbi:phage tail spike protein [Clostridium perfringens]|nr:phage tail spike protein [Clostridium perfringens]
MIELRDKDKNRVAGLVDYENLCIESVLESGDKTLSFYYPKKGKYYDEIVEEAYIRTKKDEFVVKARELDEDYTKFECSLNLEELEGNIFDRFESVEQTITSALNLAVVGTGWTVKDNTLKKRRTVRCTNKSSLEIVREIKKVYRVDIVFNTLGKQIEVYEHLGEDKGTYFIDSLNLIALQVQSDSRQYATRIIAEGKDGLSFSDINNCKNYVENYQYSRKVKTIYWKDERYTIKENLLEDARAKLEELSKPFRSYSASILNLAELNPRYSSILDFKLGDAINLISKKNKIKDKQRIVKTIEWPQDHTKDSVELANATLKFEDIQQENQETTDTVNNITTDNGTVDGSTIDSITTKQIEDFEANVIKVAKLKAILAEIENLHVNKADIQNLDAVIARIGTLEVTKASITELNAIHAIIQQIKAGKADIADLNVAVAKVGILENKTAVLENALAGNLTADNFKTNAITAGSAVIAEGAIGSSQISSLSVNKLEAGDITTSKHRIVSADGTIEIVGNQILINRNNVNRVVLGEYRKQDNTTDYGLLIRGKDGKTIMLDSDGVHNAGITNGAIDNNKVADNANISGNKLDINSVIREVNNNGTETIKGTKVTVGDRTLDVELSTQNNTITEHSKELSSQKASLTALDNALKFKVDSQTFTQSTTTINNNINRAKEEAINSANNVINNLQISFRNLAINSNFDFGWKNWGFNNPNNNATVQIIKDSVLGNCIKVTTQTSGQGVYSILKRKPKTTYSWSFMIKSDKTCKITVAHEYGEGTKEISLTTEWTKITGTGIWNGNGGALCFYSNIDNPKITYYLTNLIYVEGDKVGDWTPAPEDLKAYSDDVAKAKADLAQANAIANADGKITTEEQKRIQQAQENLNIAISKADKAKQDAILEANSIAELKKQEAINSSNSHADSKANEALNNAKAFVNSEITNVNTHLNKNTSEINILKGQIESKVSQSDIDKSIQNIKFNDVNMISNSGEFKGTDHWSCTNGSNNLTIENSILKFKFTNYANWGCYISNDSLRNKPLETSKEYTVVCRLKASRNQTLSFNICDGDSNNHVYARDLNITTEWKIFKFTFKPASIGNERQFRFITGNLGYDFDFYIEFVKMVEGATSSDSWSMAPDYVLDNIKTVTDKITTVESKLTQENNSIKASVQDLNSTTQTITTNVSNINRDLTSKINSNLDAAKSFATDIAIAKANLAKEQAIANADGKITAEEQKRIQQAQDNLNAAISKATEAEIKAKSYADVKKQEAINSANNNTANTINNLDIGIYNLANESGNFLDNTGFFVANGGTLEIDSSNTFREYNTLKIKGNSGACYKDYIELQGNTTYCYSCWIKSDRIIPLNVSTPLHMWVTESKEDDVCHREIILKYSKEINSNWQQVFIIFKTPSNKDKYIMKPFIYGIGEATVWLANFQVKKGSILNDWTPNPNDLKRYSEEVAKAKAELAKQQAIANADGKITEEERKRIQQAQENLNVAIARADKAKQEAINSANSHTDSKANEALNNAKAYTNAEITTVNSKVHNVESNLNILSDRINTKVSQSDIDKAVTTLRIERIIYARGTGNDYPANSIVKVNGKTITDGQGRGLRINALNKITLERVFLEDYDTYGDGNAINNFANKINELNNGDYIIIVTSQDASYPLNSTVKNALEKIGATLFDNKQGTYREAYALIGKSKLGRGNGIEMFIPRTETDKRFAEVSVKVGEDGTFIGVNSNNMGLEATLIKSNISDVSSSVTQLRDSVTTDIRAINSKTQSIETTLNGKASKQEVTEVNNRVATIKASLDSITQRVSSTESKTQTLESNINGKASKQEIVSINNKVASIETSLSGITNRVSSTESKTSSLEVSINSTNSELNILKNSISTKLEKIDSHIKYGSTNLLINTEFLNNFYNWNKNQYVGLDKYQEKDYVGVMIQNNRIGTEGTLWQRATLKTEVTYTLSFEEYTDDISRWWVGIYYKLNGATKYITLFDSSVNKHSWQKRVFQFKLPSGATETDVSFYNYGGSVGRVWVCNLQLEEGEFATPYKSNPLDFSKFSSAITQTVEGINTEVSKKVNGRDIISTINQSAESVKINASRINLQGYVTVGDLGSTNVTTINNAHITSGTIEGRTMIALNGTGKQNGVLTVNNGESYLEYFRCREAWMMSPYANGWRVPLVHSKYGIKDNESSSDMIDEIAFYRGTDGRNYLQITNTKTGRVEYIELYRSAFDTVTILNRLDRIDAKLAGL